MVGKYPNFKFSRNFFNILYDFLKYDPNNRTDLHYILCKNEIFVESVVTIITIDFHMTHGSKVRRVQEKVPKKAEKIDEIFRIKKKVERRIFEIHQDLHWENEFLRFKYRKTTA